MADMEKFHDDLIIINLYKLQKFENIGKNSIVIFLCVQASVGK